MPVTASAVALPLGEEPLELAADLVGGGDLDGFGEHVAPGLGTGGRVVLVLQALDERDELLVALLDLPVDLRLGAG